MNIEQYITDISSVAAHAMNIGLQFMVKKVKEAHFNTLIITMGWRKKDVTPGGRLNEKDRLTGYGDPHVKDKTSYRPSYL